MSLSMDMRGVSRVNARCVERLADPIAHNYRVPRLQYKAHSIISRTPIFRFEPYGFDIIHFRRKSCSIVSRAPSFLQNGNKRESLEARGPALCFFA